MRLITWNINSVRLRAGLVLKLMQEHQPDVICLQETKTPDDKFPFDVFRDAGYKHIHIHGMKGYNGVAIISRIPFMQEDVYHRVGKEDCRHISVHFQSDVLKKPVQLHCLYIPAGGDEPDPDINEKFAHKLAFVDEMKTWFSKNYTKDDPLIAVGDFNIAPEDQDVWSHKQLLKVVSHTPVEVEKCNAMKASLDWVDVSRQFVPLDEKCYSWWSYRNRDWKKSNRGRRLDHVWVTKPLQSCLDGHQILKEARDWEKPSDHVPVIVDLDI